MKLHYVISVASVLGAVLSFNILSEAKANVADDLNANYNKIINNCGGTDKPSYECSGNIIRLTTRSTYHVWDPSPTSIKTGGVSFTYLRKDIKVNIFFQSRTSGILYYPSMLKPSSKKKAEVKCSFPTDGFTSNGRADGCGATPGFSGSGPCQDQGIYTADSWYTHFMSVIQNSNIPYQHQCSFTMSSGTPNTAAIFDENLNAIRKVYRMDNDGLNHASYNELLVKTWPTDTSGKIANAEQLPIQAFFYMVREKNSGLEDARYYQQDYFKQTGILVPVVQVNAQDPANISFSYQDADQQVTVADELNANYNKTVDNCGSKDSPAFQCSGILFRQSSYSNNSHVWDPNAKSIQFGGISFQYLRKDLHFRNFAHTGRNSGFIYYPSQQAPNEIENARISCFFPSGAETDSRPYGRCGGYISYPKSSGECQQQGIYTADDWYKKFSDPAIVGYEKFFSQCGFNVSNCGHNTATAFSEALKAHNLAYANTVSERGGTNEIVVRTQDTDVNGKSVNPEKLPLQAFYYQNATGLIEAQAYQQDYYNTIGKIVPVVYMNTTDFNNISFEYKTTDQVDLKKKSNIAQELTENYDKVVDNCGSESSPAFACSGNIIRFTNYSIQYHVWNPSPAAAGRKGVSFMYVRQDLPLDKSFKDKTSGLIYYPTKMMPLSKELSSVRCAFPVDGYSDRRYTNGQNDACGTNINYPNDSQPCQEQGITTGQHWYAHFSSIPDIDKNRLNHQCGFNLATNELNQASIFKAAIDGQKLLQDARGSASYNELVLSIPSYNAFYQIDNPAALPIEAFFYTNETGLTEARGYQQDYHNTVGVDAPIVKLGLDITTGLITYSYDKADQTDAYNQAKS